MAERKYHQNFLDYQKFIASHPNYAGFPEAIDASGAVKWVTAGISALGQRRKQWWLAKGAELAAKGVVLPKHAPLSPIALFNHPTKKKACQTCGRILSLEYVYLNANSAKAINKIFGTHYKEEDLKTIFEVMDELETLARGNYRVLDSIFPGILRSKDLAQAKDFVQKEFVEKFTKRLSPGAMSNCPDRFDGYHSYNKCCRATEDTGRHATNLNRYGEDRRAYENWADGDWKAASWLMREFNKHKVSADHIGPISLGFSHRPTFQPMSKAANSSKGNRMTLADFNRLLADEQNGEAIVSWHSKPIWTRLKKHAKTDRDVGELCKYMRRNMHHVLTIFARLFEDGMEDLLASFLNPEHAYYAIAFEGFDPATGKYARMSKTRGTRAEYARNAERYQRIAFEQLVEYQAKSNRKTKDLHEADLLDYSAQVKKALEEQGTLGAKTELVRIFDLLAAKAEGEFLAGKELMPSLLDE